MVSGRNPHLWSAGLTECSPEGRGRFKSIIKNSLYFYVVPLTRGIPDRNLTNQIVISTSQIFPLQKLTKLDKMLYNPNGNQQNAFTVATANYDTRRYPLCCPHDGTKGLAFRRFADDFLTAVATVDLKDPNEIYDCAEAMLGIDEGGPETPPGLAAPIPIAGAPAQRRRARRLKQQLRWPW